jgi:hypothetical protein
MLAVADRDEVEAIFFNP